MLKTLKHAALGLALAAGATVAHAADTIRFAVTDISGLESLQTEFGKFRATLTEATGLEFQFFPVSSRTAAVEALRSNKVDFVLTGPAEYVVINKLTKAYPIMGFSRPDYFAVVVTMADAGIASPLDLKGKRIAFEDVGSTSKHLAPAQAMADQGLNLADVQPMHVSINVAWEALKRGDIAAMGMNHGNFMKLRGKEKDFPPGAFRVIARGPDLPNDVLMAGAHVDKKVVEKVRDAFATHSDKLIDAILVGEDNQKYLGMRFIPGIKDSDYDYVRSMYRTIGHPEFSNFVGD